MIWELDFARIQGRKFIFSFLQGESWSLDFQKQNQKKILIQKQNGLILVLIIISFLKKYQSGKNVTI